MVAERKKTRKAESSPRELLPGTRLVRDWKGVSHQVTVLTDGFEYQGLRFSSLSAIARAITDTRWNGWVFFGIPNPNRKERAA